MNTCHSHAARRYCSAMALPMVLWAIALLAGIVILLAGVVEGWISEETRAGKLFRARQQALSGLAIARSPAILPGDPLLEHHDGNTGEGYKVVIKDEAGLINPNSWLNPDNRGLFGILFTAWGLDKISCDTAADGLFDWQSQVPFRSLRGAKQAEYEAAGKSGLPPGAPFVSPEEMELVIGFDPVRKAKPDWRSYFTTYWTGKINLLHAPKPILTDFVGLTSQQADAWITLRNGKDGIEGTADDFAGKPPKDIPEACLLMGIKTPMPNIVSACDIQGSVRRIESTGTCNGVKQTITVVLDSSGNMLGWSEQ